MSARKYHKGAFINSAGGVSALCFSTKRAIDLTRASWTNRNEAVTCEKCLSILADLAAHNEAFGFGKKTKETQP